eukprot:2358808-Pyramimonas_sp.AAC.2
MGYSACTTTTAMRLGMLPQPRAVSSLRRPATACSQNASRLGFSLGRRFPRTSAKAARFQIFASTEEKTEDVPTPSAAPSSANSSKQINKAVNQAAATFAPRSSTAKKNPATKGTVLYSVFE